jgi:hypothetical protein
MIIHDTECRVNKLPGKDCPQGKIFCIQCKFPLWDIFPLYYLQYQNIDYWIIKHMFNDLFLNLYSMTNELRYIKKSFELMQEVFIIKERLIKKYYTRQPRIWKSRNIIFFHGKYFFICWFCVWPENDLGSCSSQPNQMIFMSEGQRSAI